MIRGVGCTCIILSKCGWEGQVRSKTFAPFVMRITNGSTLCHDLLKPIQRLIEVNGEFSLEDIDGKVTTVP